MITSQDVQISFDQLALGEPIRRAIAEVGYERPTPIQAAAIPEILAGRDIVACAQTGTGKTASFVLPMLERLSAGRARARMPRSLILSPTRELATQTADNFRIYGKYLKLDMALLIGGVAMGDQEKVLERGVDVLIATPGRLLDWFERGKVLLGGVDMLVIDESDRMLDMGFIPDVERIIQLLMNRKQTMMFSATMPKEVRRLAEKFLREPCEIQVAPPASRADGIEDVLVPVGAVGKRGAVEHLLSEKAIGKAILFCNRKRDVGLVTRFLQRRQKNARDIHGDLDQKQRQDTLDAFKRGEIDLLVATDVAARGLDISDMPVVINLDVPGNPDDYVHRIGRTGRAGKTGRAFTLITDEDQKSVASIERLLGKTIERYHIPSETDASGAGGALAQSSGGERASGGRRRRPAVGAKAEAAAAPEARGQERRPRQPTASPRRERGRGEGEKEPAIVGMGDHTPSFILRPVPLKPLSGSTASGD